MRVLILGGTNFIGPHLVEALRERGHEIALFNRGKTAPDAFEDLEQLRGDRKTGDYDALAGGQWDVVVDMCAYWPRAVNEALEALAGRVDHYVFISTISVYAEFDADGYDEDAPLAEVEDAESEEVGAGNYGGLKALCEQALDIFEGPVSIIRPGLVAGPGDVTDRFTYWPVRFSRGGEALSPGNPEDPIQYIDVRDLVAFIVETVEGTIEGTFNAVTPAGSLTIGELVDASIEAAESPATGCWVSSDFLHEHKVAPWSDLPAWVPPGSPLGGIPWCSSERALSVGLTFTPIGDTVRDTLAWFEAQRGDELRAGLSEERETEILRAWHAQDAE